MDFLRQLILTFLHISENPVNVFKLKLTFYFLQRRNSIFTIFATVVIVIMLYQKMYN